ncbi:hypothetical protein MXB_4772 [Myxobolus squamalis]|nr:hypothetical protein MXB_4772 [Myxobolus squamalis]
MPDLHILFMVHSVSHKEKDDAKKKRSCDEIIGYSWIKVRENREYNLPIVTHLPENYLKYNLENADKSKSLVDLKWIDGVGSDLFKFNLTFFTNYFTDNEHIQKLMSFVDEKGVSSDTCSQLAAFIKWINSIGSRVMIIHLNIILNLLFEILQKSSKFKNDMKNKYENYIFNLLELTIYRITVLLFIGAEICKMQRADLLRGYFIFNPDINPMTENIHDIILKHLASSINYGSDLTMTHNFYSKNRKNLLKASTIDGFGELVGLVRTLSVQRLAIKYLQEISQQYAINHFPLWLIFSQVKGILNSSYESRKYGIRLMRNLLIKLHFDDRYNGNNVSIYRIHILFLPFVTILKENLHIFEQSMLGNIFDLPDDSTSLSDMQGSVKEVVPNKKKWTASLKTIKEPLDSDIKVYSNDSENMLYSKKDLREIMMMFLQIFSSIDFTVAMDYIKSFCTNVTSTSSSYTSYDTKKSKNKSFLESILSMLKISLSLFDYQVIQGKRYIFIIKLSKSNTFATMHSVKSTRLDSSIKIYTSFINKHKAEMDSNLFYEVCMIVLDYIEKIYISFKTVIENELGENNLMKSFFSIHIFLLQASVPFIVRKHHFSQLRQFVAKAQLLIYLILRSDFSFSGLLYHRSYISIIMACSTVVDQSSCFNFLFDSMKELWNLVKSDETMKNSDFSSQISDLTKRVKNIIRLTVRFKELETNPESLVDAHCSIFNSFTGVPELQQTWLERIALIQTKNENHSEAAMCYIEIAALIALTLKRKKILPNGYLVFEPITPNINPNEFTFKEDALTDENLHTLETFISNIKKASNSFIKAERYEIIIPLSKIIGPFFENDANYEELSKLHELLKMTYDQIISSIKKRYLGTYYRVAFYGNSFKENHYCQFIYKEPKLSQLGVVIERFRDIYEPQCVDLSIINESNKVKYGELDQNKDYIQINAVKQIIKITSNQDSSFLSHNNIGEFVLETPFTKSGKAHGSVADQWKRITTFTTSKCFPDIKRRIPIIKSKVYEMTPIEVAIDEMKTQVKDLKFLVNLKPPDMKGLQLKLQGSVCVTVNAGPLAYANTFLKRDVKISLPVAYTVELESIFKAFIDICGTALALNGELIKEDQLEYQKDLSNKFLILTADLNELLTIDDKK